MLDQLVELSKRGNTIQEQNVDYTLALVMEDSEENVLEIDKDIICHTLQGKPIKPKTLGQKKYVDAIRKQMIDSDSDQPVPVRLTLRWQWRSLHSRTMK